MDLDVARDFLRANHRSVLATTRRDGRPQMSPVAHAVAEDGRILISTREPTSKARNVRRDPTVSLMAISDGWYGEWVQVDGRAEIVSLPEAMEVLVDYYRRVAGEHPDWADYRRAMVDEQRCVIRVTIERAGPDGRG